jgi:hypothetical protein
VTIGGQLFVRDYTFKITLSYRGGRKIQILEEKGNTCSRLDGTLDILTTTKGLFEALLVEFRNHIEELHFSNQMVVELFGVPRSVLCIV